MMLRQAMSAEAYRAVRNPRALFWAYALVPLFILIFGLGIELAVRIETRSAIPPVEPLRLAIRSLGAGGNPVAQLFYAIGAAALVANEYRWESWRLIAPRNTRPNLILAKYAIYLSCTAISLVAIIAAELGSTLAGAAIKGAPVAWTVAGAPGWPGLAAAWAASLAELAALGAIAMAGAVATRSLLGGASRSSCSHSASRCCLPSPSPRPASTVRSCFRSRPGTSCAPGPRVARAATPWPAAPCCWDGRSSS